MTHGSRAISTKVHLPQTVQWSSSSRATSALADPSFAGNPRRSFRKTAPVPIFRHCLRPSTSACTSAQASKTGLKSKCSIPNSPAPTTGRVAGLYGFGSGKGVPNREPEILQGFTAVIHRWVT